MTEPRELVPDTTPVDPAILDTAHEGLDAGSPGRKGALESGIRAAQAIHEAPATEA